MQRLSGYCAAALKSLCIDFGHYAAALWPLCSSSLVIIQRLSGQYDSAVWSKCSGSMVIMHWSLCRGSLVIMMQLSGHYALVLFIIMHWLFLRYLTALWSFAAAHCSLCSDSLAILQ